MSRMRQKHELKPYRFTARADWPIRAILDINRICYAGLGESRPTLIQISDAHLQSTVATMTTVYKPIWAPDGLSGSDLEQNYSTSRTPNELA